MNEKIKVMTIVGTRPELIKLSRVIAELDRYTTHILVHSGQNYDYELNGVFFRDLEIREPDYFMNAAVAGNPMQTIANVLVEADRLFKKEQPDAVLIYGDTNTALSVIPAKRRKIPVFHMEAGNRCFDQRVPEELNRTIVDHLSDINMPLSEHARRYLEREGIRPETIIKTGSCMREIFDYFNGKLDSSDVLERMNMQSGDYFVVSAHREENVDDTDNLTALLDTLTHLGKQYGKRVIVSTHPRTKDRIDKIGFDVESSEIVFLKPLGFIDYVVLQKNAFCVISDSGTITEESSLLGFPAVMVRNAHERPEGMDEGTVVMSGLRWETVRQAVDMVTSQYREGFVPRTVEDYEVNAVSKKVVRIILSYTGYIKRTVWSEW